jgi:hypothetical protein
MAAPKRRVPKAGSRSTTDATSAGSDTGITQTDVSAGKRLAEAETTTDIGHGESAIRGVLADRNQWDANQKALFDDSRATAGRLQGFAELALSNAVTLANLVNNNAANHSKNLDGTTHSEREETLRIGKLAGDRIWNINETDAYGTIMAAGIARAVLERLKEEEA